MLDASRLLFLHSYFRWIVLFALAIQFIWISVQYKRKKEFTSSDFKLLIFFALLYNIQLILGWLLYANSFIVAYFWQDVAVAIKNRGVRFFGLEHMTMMSLAILLANYSTYKAFKNKNKTIVFKKLWKTYIWILLMILSSIPWSFSPLTSRPNFR